MFIFKEEEIRNLCRDVKIVYQELNFQAICILDTYFKIKILIYCFLCRVELVYETFGQCSEINILWRGGLLEGMV